MEGEGPRGITMTVEDGGHPVHDGTPEVDPANELKIIGRVLPSLGDIVDDFVKYSDGACRTERILDN
jgi:hypothetical protein